MTRARCVVLSPRVPWPQDDGGRVGLWQGLLAAASRFETRLVALHVGPAPPSPPAILHELGVEVNVVAHRPPAAVPALLRGTFGRWPYMLARFRSGALEQRLRAIVASWRPDLAFIHHLHMATYVDTLEGIPSVLREHNLEQLWMERFARASRNPAVAAYAWHQVGRMRAAEARLCRAMALILATHEEEAAAIRGFAGSVPVETVGVGATFVDLDRRVPAAEPTLVVVGAFDREANAEGAERFLDQGWPLVRTRLPHARLRIVGRGIPARLAALAREAGAEAAGFVPDLAGELARAWGIVIPLWQGAGIRVKLVEAIAAGVPVAATPLAVEGLDLEPGHHYFEGGDAAALGRAAHALLAEPERAREMAAAAHAFLEPTYAHEAVLQRTADLCERALAGHAPEARAALAGGAGRG